MLFQEQEQCGSGYWIDMTFSAGFLTDINTSHREMKQADELMIINIWED